MLAGHFLVCSQHLPAVCSHGAEGQAARRGRLIRTQILLMRDPPVPSSPPRGPTSKYQPRGLRFHMGLFWGTQPFSLCQLAAPDMSFPVLRYCSGTLFNRHRLNDGPEGVIQAQPMGPPTSSPSLVLIFVPSRALTASLGTLFPAMPPFVVLSVRVCLLVMSENACHALTLG